ncbi:MAG TPA: GAF domain-containing protein [Caldilineae bacterium]|nr:GAF domain-containing protein [Caldilineae bacterium]
MKNIVLVRLYDAKGHLVAEAPALSTPPHVRRDIGFQRALVGETWSKLESAEELVAEGHWPSGVLPPYVMETYVPVVAGEGEPIIGVFEIYADVTAKYQEHLWLRNTALAVLAVGMGILFAALSIVSHRAQGLLQRRTEILEALMRTVAEAARAQEIPTLLQTVLDQTLAVMGAPIGAVWALGHTAVRGVSPDIGALSWQTAQSLNLELAEPSVVADLLAEAIPEPYDEAARAFAARTGVRAFIIVPVHTREGQPVGGLAIAYPQPHHWSEEEIALVEAVGRELGIMAERLQLIGQLQGTNAQLKEALQAKDIMIQNVSHELRTPLTLIRGYLELMAEGLLGPLNEEQAKAVQTMLRNAERQRFMIDRLLMMRALGPDAVQKKPLELREWLRGVVQNWQHRAREAGINLILDVPDEPLDMEIDTDLLAQAMDNLLDNAIKFSPDGGTVRVRAWREDGHVHIAVSDEGIGIPPDKLERIFERFYQVDGSTTRRFEGLGIGLALVREIVELHGGHIWAESGGEGKGATFHVTLPSNGG